ncbi:MAG: DUF3086 domain-containing protein, partial [Pseudanabaena sp. LacPavin_0818_WC45_MAG_42_6]|nr:DUF3086 domain-containing protein [Pseudanabaena sp. LacPavin_0818_WC45_MAG_42_6]
MESDQLPVEENLKENLDQFHQEAPPEAISSLGNTSDNEFVEVVGESIDENIHIEQSLFDNRGDQSTDDNSDAIESKSIEIKALIPETEPEAQPQDSFNTSEILTIINQLKQEESELRGELESLKNIKSKILQDQLDDLQAGIIRLAQADVARLEYQKQELQAAIAVLEKRKERLDKEMTSTYAGTSQDIAIRVQGFKDYLVGSLQDLVASAEKLNLVATSPQPVTETVAPIDKQPVKEAEPLRLSEQTFAEYK